MVTLLTVSTILLGIACIVLAWRFWLLRGWYKEAAAQLGWASHPIAAVEVEEVDPLFAPTDGLGPGLHTEVAMLGGVTLGGVWERESWILSVLAKRAERMFEFGTASGRTAYLWARNSTPDARVVTLTLHPEERNLYSAERKDTAAARKTALEESRHERFYYSGTPYESKITQLFGDSKRLDVTPYEGMFDLIFIDGSHAYSYVQHDTASAFRMAKPGALILWHDYSPGAPAVAGVYNLLNELRHALPLGQIAMTRLVFCRVTDEHRERFKLRA